MAEMHEEIPGRCRLPVAQGTAMAKGQDKWCPHTVRMKHWFIARFERGVKPWEKPHPLFALGQSPLQANPSTSWVMIYLRFSYV